LRLDHGRAGRFQRSLGTPARLEQEQAFAVVFQLLRRAFSFTTSGSIAALGWALRHRSSQTPASR
jgi:hypothetical protein